MQQPNKLHVIPQKVLAMAKAIQKAQQNKQQICFVGGRRWGLNAAVDLAMNTVDQEENIKKLERGRGKQS